MFLVKYDNEAKVWTLQDKTGQRIRGTFETALVTPVHGKFTGEGGVHIRAIHGLVLEPGVEEAMSPTDWRDLAPLPGMHRVKSRKLYLYDDGTWGRDHERR
jgi:hypothetical protein